MSSKSDRTKSDNMFANLKWDPNNNIVQTPGRELRKYSEPDDSEFWESVPKYPDRTAELKVIDASLSDRKNAFFEEAKKSESVSKEVDVKRDIKEPLTNRRSAFLEEAKRNESINKENDPAQEIEDSLTNRKSSLMKDFKRANSVVTEKADPNENIEESLTNRKTAFFTETSRSNSITKENDPKEEITETLKNRKSAFMRDVKRSQSVKRDHNPTQEIQSSLGERKSAIFERTKQAASVDKGLGEINRPLRARMTQFFEEAKRNESFTKEIDAKQDIEESLSVRRRSLMAERERNNSVKKGVNAKEDIEESLSNRRNAFFEQANKRSTSISEESELSPKEEIEESLNNRKEAFFSDVKQRESLSKEYDQSDIETPLIKRKYSLLEEMQRNATTNRNKNATDVTDRKDVGRRRSFRDKESDDTKEYVMKIRPSSRNLTHRSRQIDSDSGLHDLLDKRRAISETSDDLDLENQDTLKGLTDMVEEDFSKLLNDIDNSFNN